MDPLQQGVEVETRLTDDHDLAVNDATLGQVGQQRFDELWEVTRERPLVAAAELYLRAVAEDYAAKAVPLGLVEHPAALRHLPAELCQHRGHRRHDRQFHRTIVASGRSATAGREGPAVARRPLQEPQPEGPAVARRPLREPVALPGVHDRGHSSPGLYCLLAAEPEPFELAGRMGVSVDADPTAEVAGKLQLGGA